MLETIFESSTGTDFTTATALFSILTALLLGIVVSFAYSKSVGTAKAPQNFLITLIVLPAVIAIIIFLVGSNVARAFSLAGAFSLVRFRSEPGDPKDIAYICIVMAIGLACGMGFYLYAAVFTVILSLVMVLATAFMEKNNKATQLVKIVVPENLNFTSVFEQVFEQYTDRHSLLSVKTVDLGSLYRLDYEVILKDSGQEKAFIDDLRVRNGNMDISVLHQLPRK